MHAVLLGLVAFALKCQYQFLSAVDFQISYFDSFAIMKPPCKEYCCRYYHDGTWWGLNITAYDSDDATKRAAKLGNLQLLGELGGTISAAVPEAGFLARAWAFVKTIGRENKHAG
jgi:hypothetical protein